MRQCIANHTQFTFYNAMSTTITSEKIAHLAHLASLKIDPSQSEFYAEQLSRIVELVEQMNSINTDNITPMTHPQNMDLRLRKDEASATNQRENYQKIAPATEQGLYLTPQVIE